MTINFRLRFLLDIVYTILVPCFILNLLLARVSLAYIFRVPCYPIFILLWGTAKQLYRRLQNSKDANRLDARPIPCVIGKLPGNVDVLWRMLRSFQSSYILETYLGLFKEYQCTTLNLRILWVDCIISMDQEHIKFVTSTGFNKFYRGPYQRERFETFLGNGIFNRDDEMWKMHRSTARPFFARERISDLDLFERHTMHTLSIISGLEHNNQPCEVQDLYARFTLDTSSEFLFGKNLDTLSASLPAPGNTHMGSKGSATNDSWGSFAQAFDGAQIVVTRRSRIGYIWPLFELFRDRNKPHARTIHNWLDPLVQTALFERKSCGANQHVSDKTFLQHLVDSTDDIRLIRDQLLSVLLASRDTTSCLLTFLTYSMAMYPDITKRLRAEVLDICGPDNSPTSENIKDLKYMRAVINETLRLFTPVPLNARQSRSSSSVLPPSDATFPTSPQRLYMPANTPIMYFPLLVHKNPALWGSDADEFDPDRWLKRDRMGKYLANPTIFTPFSAGPRICLGQNYALNEASYFLVRLLQAYDTFTLVPSAQPEGSLPPEHWKHMSGRQSKEKIWPASALTLFVKGGLWVRFGKVAS